MFVSLALCIGDTDRSGLRSYRSSTCLTRCLCGADGSIRDGATQFRPNKGLGEGRHAAAACDCVFSTLQSAPLAGGQSIGATTVPVSESSFHVHVHVWSVLLQINDRRRTCTSAGTLIAGRTRQFGGASSAFVGRTLARQSGSRALFWMKRRAAESGRMATPN